MILRDESDDEVQVQPSEPVAEVTEKVSSQTAQETGSSRPLKRLRKLNSDDQAPRVSPPAKRLKKQRARRAVEESISEEGMEATAVEGGQESLIPQDPTVVESLPSAEPELMKLTNLQSKSQRLLQCLHLMCLQ